MAGGSPPAAGDRRAANQPAAVPEASATGGCRDTAALAEPAPAATQAVFSRKPSPSKSKWAWL